MEECSWLCSAGALARETQFLFNHFTPNRMRERQNAEYGAVPGMAYMKGTNGKAKNGKGASSLVPNVRQNRALQRPR